MNNRGIYENKGIESNISFPGSRYESISFMDEKNEKLWLFGGYGFDNESNGKLFLPINK